MTTSLLFLALGLALLLVGGDLLVRGASGLARAAGVSPLIVGLTVVAFGTSAPELAVNLLAALDGKPGLSFGNVVGSNLANIGFILGLTAMVRPLEIQGKIITREIPLMLLSTLAVLALALDPTLTGREAVLDRGDGVVLLLFFLIFIYSAAKEIVVQRARRDPLVKQAEHVEAPGQTRAMLANVALVVVGLAGLLYGGDRTVESAIDLAVAFGVSETVIGLLIVGVGTSLPELATSILAVRKGETDIAVGNVVGSNVFNLLLVLGTTATVAEVPVPAGGIIDLLAVLALSLILLPFALSYDRRLVRWEGGVLMAGWIGYSVWRFMNG